MSDKPLNLQQRIAQAERDRIAAVFGMTFEQLKERQSRQVVEARVTEVAAEWLAKQPPEKAEALAAIHRAKESSRP
jgi:cation transport regulator ChaB